MPRSHIQNYLKSESLEVSSLHLKLVSLDFHINTQWSLSESDSFEVSCLVSLDFHINTLWSFNS